MNEFNTGLERKFISTPSGWFNCPSNLTFLRWCGIKFLKELRNSSKCHCFTWGSTDSCRVTHLTNQKGKKILRVSPKILLRVTGGFLVFRSKSKQETVCEWRAELLETGVAHRTGRLLLKCKTTCRVTWLAAGQTCAHNGQSDSQAL